MSKIVKMGTHCDSCGKQEDADKQVWIKNEEGLFSYCRVCYNEMS